MGAAEENANVEQISFHVRKGAVRAINDIVNLFDLIPVPYGTQPPDYAPVRLPSRCRARVILRATPYGYVSQGAGAKQTGRVLIPSLFVSGFVATVDID